MEQFRSEVVQITPEMASAWLQKRCSNRKPSQMHLLRMATQLSAGHWNFDGSPIRFCLCGHLIDGQHRLLACVKADVPLTAVVQWGLPCGAFESIDSNLKGRRVADALYIQREVNVHSLAATIAWQYRLQTGTIQYSFRATPTTAEALAVLEAHPAIRDSVRLYASGTGAGKLITRLLPGSIAAFLHYEFATVDAQLAEQFFDHLAKGVDLVSGHPIYRLRERLIDNRASKAKLPPQYMIAIAHKAWSAWVIPRPLGVLKWHQDEPFPAVAIPTGDGFPPPEVSA